MDTPINHIMDNKNWTIRIGTTRTKNKSTLTTVQIIKEEELFIYLLLLLLVTILNGGVQQQQQQQQMERATEKKITGPRKPTQRKTINKQGNTKNLETNQFSFFFLPLIIWCEHTTACGVFSDL